MVDSNALDGLARSANIGVRKLLGRTYLRENRWQDACENYVGILEDYPGDADVLIIMGNLYRISGCPGTAEHLYGRALESDPVNQMLKKMIAEAHEEKGQAAEETLPFMPEAIQRLVARLRVVSEQTAEGGALIRGAADMLDRLIAEAQPPQVSADNDGMPGPVKDDFLMPALIEINIRQARAEGQAELAEALQSLQIHLTRQAGS